MSSGHGAAPLALTLGDPAGIGPEITAKAWAQLCRSASSHPFALIAPLAAAQQACQAQDLPPPVALSNLSQAHEVFARALPVLPIPGHAAIPGRPDPKNAEAITASIERAVSLALCGEASAVVTNPIAKSVLYAAGFTHPGHTEYLGALTQELPVLGPRGPVMMLTADSTPPLRCALITVHEPLHAVAGLISQAEIIRITALVHHALQQDFGIAAPRIALCGLNPHAGEDGALGTQERDIINPAAASLRARGLDVTDAQSADTLFHAQARQGYDAVIAMYHDQGLIPVKTLDFHGGVNITLGLPLVRTSPDHGTAFNIAGKGIARPDSLIAALGAASAMAAARAKFAGAR